MSSKNISENPAEPRVDEIMDKEVSDSSYLSDASPEQETWRRNKKQRTVSQSRESSVSPAKRRRVVQSEQGSTEFPPSRPGGQQHVPPFIPMQSQSNQTSPGMFYPPYPFPYQHMWMNSPQCDSGFGNWPVPSVRPSMAPPSTSCSMASVQNRRSSGSNSDADGVSIFAPMDDSLVDQESQGSKRADKRPKPPSLLFVTPSSASGDETDAKSVPCVQGGKNQSSFAYNKEALVSSLYKTKREGVRKPKPSQLQESHLYKAFGDAAVIQGVEDESAPKLCFDPSQRLSLQSSLCATEPLKLKAQPKFRVNKYPLHDSTHNLLCCAKVDPVFLKRKDLKKQGLDAEKNLVISQVAEGLDNNLLSVQKAMMTGMAAILALQQGLGSVMSELSHSPDTFDPAKSKAILTEAFEASQETLDQIGRACALQYHARGVNIVIATKYLCFQQ